MSTRRVAVSLILSLLAIQLCPAQAPSSLPTRWFSMFGGVGLAGGAGYETVSERKASVSLVFPAYGHRVEASALGAWTGETVVCPIAGASSCKGAPTLAGGALSLLGHLGLGSGLRTPVLSAGVGAYRLPDGAIGEGLRSGFYPAVQSGVEEAFPTTDGFAITIAAHVILLPNVHAKQFFYLPVSVGFRVW